MTEVAPVTNAPVMVEGDEEKGRHVVAARAFSAGTVIATITGHREVTAANRFSVQVGAGKHVREFRLIERVDLGQRLQSATPPMQHG